MVRKIGNIFLFLFIASFPALCFGGGSIGIDVRILDEQGNSITKTGVGIPTILEVIVRGTSSSAEKIYIDGLEDFDIEQRGTTKQLSTINGVTSTKTVYRYMIRAQKEGSYTIGPVQVQIDTTTYNSETRLLEVERGYRPSSAGAQKVALEVQADKQTIVAGERVPVSIRFYVDKECELLGIDPLELQHCKMSIMKGPFAGVAERNGVQQKYLEWQTALIPQKAGELTIPALKAHYKASMGSAGLHTSLLGGLFDFGYAKKYIYSDSLNIHVEPLPTYEGQVHAIGLFTSLRAKLNQHEAKQGEGIVLSLELEGEGDLDSIMHPELQLPESLTYYDSKATTAASGTKKTFEYIVQGKKEGSCEIPSQEFIFFDVDDKTYKVLQTTSLPLTIIASQKSSDHKTKNESRETIEETTTQDVWPANEKNQTSTPSQSGLPPYILWVGFILPFMICLARGSCFLFHWYTMRDSSALKKKNAFVEAKNRIKIAVKTHDTAQVYDIFITFIADRHDVEPAQVSQDLIRQKLVRLSEATAIQWETFFSKVTEQAYANRHLTLQEKEELFKSALMWLILFQKSESV